MKISAYGKSDRGKVRAENEDAFLVENEAGVFCVADGLGGLANGREASRIAVRTLQEYTSDGRLADFEVFNDFFLRSNEGVQSLGESLGSAVGSGTTCTVARIDAETGEGYFGHIGDSAAYLLRDGELKKLTTDHTQAEEMRRLYPGRPVPEVFEHTLTRCLGQPGRIDPDFFSNQLQPGDRILLCTDGVTRPVSEKELERKLAEATSPKAFVDDLIATVLDRGAPDNATAVTVFLE